MMSLLSEILQQTEATVRDSKSRTPLRELQKRVRDMPPARSLKKALSAEPFGIIAEIKRRSPSAGEMNERNVHKAPSVYNACRGVVAFSVLTDEPYFGGSLEMLDKSRRRTAKPLLRKDFIIDEYQVWESRAFQADAILLMASAHVGRPERLAELYAVAKEVGLQCLVEVGMSHASPDEQLAMVPAEAEIVGINSRKFDGKRITWKHRVSKIIPRLRTLVPDVSVDIARHVALRSKIALGKIAVAESGITSTADIATLRGLNYHACLIGTAFLQATRIEQVVSDFSQAALARMDKTETASESVSVSAGRSRYAPA